MANARKTRAKTMPTKKGTRNPRKQVTALPPAPAPEPPSAPLALAPAEPAEAPVPRKRDTTVLPSNSLVRQKVLAIIALRLKGETTEAIAEQLGIKEATIRQYMFLAGKNGWLKRMAVDPTDRLEHEIAHKVVRNLDEMLDSDNEARKDKATLVTAEGMLFKRVAADAGQQPALTAISIKVVMPEGANTIIREGTTGGTEKWVEGEVVGGK